MKNAVDGSGIQLGMLLPMRYEPAYQGLKKIVDSGEIGEVIQISAQKSGIPASMACQLASIWARPVKALPGCAGCSLR